MENIKIRTINNSRPILGEKKKITISIIRKGIEKSLRNNIKAVATKYKNAFNIIVINLLKEFYINYYTDFNINELIMSIQYQ